MVGLLPIRLKDLIYFLVVGFWFSERETVKETFREGLARVGAALELVVENLSLGLDLRLLFFLSSLFMSYNP